MPLDDSDSSLLARVVGGDDTAFRALFDRHYPRVYRVAFGLMLSREAAEDLAQDAFLELHKHAAGLRVQEGNSLGAWLCRVALNRGYNTLRDGRRAREHIESFVTTHEADAYAELERIEERARVREVLARLNERQSKLLLLRYAGFSLAEIAPVLGVAPGSVGTLLARAERAFAAAYSLMHPADQSYETEPNGPNSGSTEKRKL